MTSTRRIWTSLAVLLLVGWLPGHGGGSGGVVVLPHAIAVSEVDTETLATYSFGPDEDISLRLAPELASASVALFVDGEEMPVIGTISGVSMELSGNEVSWLREAGVRVLKYELVVASGKAQVLRFRIAADGSDTILEVR